MAQVQKMIDAMHNGNVEMITQCIKSQTPVLAVNAIIAGGRIGLHDVEYINGLKVAEKSTETLLGIPIQKLAVAALHLSGEKKYDGNDKQIKNLIKTKFDM